MKENAKISIQELKVGGIIYYNRANGFHSPEQVAALSAGLQKLTKTNRIPIPLLIATDQEGGSTARLQEGFTEFPGNRTLGETGNPRLAEAAAFPIGQELQAVGINMNLAPVVDVNSNPKNPIIGIRSFGENPETVTAFGNHTPDGYEKAGIISTLKHFPDHGDTEIDSHEDLPVIGKSKEEPEKCELLPFARLAPYADAILIPILRPLLCIPISFIF